MSDKEKFEPIILIDDTLWKSILRDVVTFTFLVGSISIGIYFESSALQWIGGVMFSLWLVSSMSKETKKNTMTIEDALDLLLTRVK